MKGLGIGVQTRAEVALLRGEGAKTFRDRCSARPSMTHWHCSRQGR